MVLGEESLKELKDEVSQLRMDLNRVSEVLLGQRFGSVERAMASKHMRLYVNQATNYLGEAVKNCVNLNCSKKEDCLNKFSDELNSVFEQVESQSLDDVFNGIQDRLNQIQAVIDEAESKPCKACYSNLRDLLVEQDNNLKEIAGYEPRINQSSGINVDVLIERVLKPLSHPARLKIIVALNQGSAGFSELSELTGMRGGHILFHLEQLVASGLMSQSRNKGEYEITELGIEVLRRLRAIAL
jgi:DNA-binding transcriptional ArsR family regulator